MAAAIKMDELLVKWLGSDSMYEHVLSLIEDNKLATQKQQQQQQQQEEGQQQQQQQMTDDEKTGDEPPPDEESKDNEASSSTTATATATSTSTAKDDNDDASSQGNNTAASPRCVIPKFYLKDPSRPRRRRRLLPMPQSDTWEPLPEGERQPEDGGGNEHGVGIGIGIGNNGDGHTNNGDDQHQQTLMMAMTGGEHGPDGSNHNNSNNNNNQQQATAMPCVRDQVQAVYAEMGRPLNQESGKEEFKDKFITVQEFVRITKDIFRFPTFFNVPLCQRLLHLWRCHQQQNDSNSENENTAIAIPTSMEEPPPDEPITYQMLEWYWHREMEPYDYQERFFRLCKQPNAEFIVRDDFLPFIKALLNDHPGLEFLSNHAEFQEKYAVTVITRIFYCVNKCHSGRITCRQIRRSDLLDAFCQVDDEEDINKVTRYFSYEHFYVLYCRFWELDHDRDYRITREDLLKYGDHSLSHMVVDRIFDAAPRPFEQPSALDQPNTMMNNNNKVMGEDIDDVDEEGGGNNNNKAMMGINREYLSYEDFIYFMLSEEDKANDVSVRYWFTCVDVDGDGRLNNMEMRSFYAVQLHRMQCMGHEIVPFEDMLCQMMDMIKPANTDYLVVEDFLQPECAPVAGALFDALFNLNKYLMFEQRDPFVERQKREDEFDTDWDRFACIDYNRLAMEEEAREEEAMEIDWVTVDDDDEDGLAGGGMQMQLQSANDYMGNAHGGGGGYGGIGSSEAPF